MHLWHWTGCYQCTQTRRSQGALAAECCCESRASMGAVVQITGNSTCLTSVLQLHTGPWINYWEFIWPLRDDAWEQGLTLCCPCVYSKRNSTGGFSWISQGAEMVFLPQKFIKTHLKPHMETFCMFNLYFSGWHAYQQRLLHWNHVYGEKMWFLSHVSIWLFVL